VSHSEPPQSPGKREWRRFGILAASLIVIMVVLQVTSVRQDSVVWDELPYVGAGYSYWVTGDYRLNPEHPPLAKLLDAIPLLVLKPRLPLDDPSWAAANQAAFGERFLFHNRLPPEEILFAARSVTIALTSLFALAIGLWAWRRGGLWAAAIALVLFTFDPNIIAHGRYATNDLPVTMFIFLSCVLFARALRRQTVPAYALAGVAIGLACTSKASGAFLIVALPIVMLLYRPDWKRTLRGAIVAIVSAVAVIALEYRGNLGGYIASVQWQLNHYNNGHPTYLLGQPSNTGWWYYFPLAFLFKTPLGTLLLGLASAALIWKERSNWRMLASVLVPAAIFAAFCIHSKDDEGLRYLLPFYPLAFAALAVVLARHAPRWLVVIGLVVLVLESLSIYPDYLAFFNAAAGGPDNGPRLLLASNIDWGQDAWRLRSWIAQNHPARLCLDYFGSVPEGDLGIDFVADSPRTQAQAMTANCMFAVSVTDLFWWQDDLRWLSGYPPYAKAGHSIYIYEFTRGSQQAYLPHQTVCPANARVASQSALGNVDSLQVGGAAVAKDAPIVLPHNRSLEIAGWMAPRSGLGSAICLLVDDSPTAPTTNVYSVARPDVAAALHDQSREGTGFDLTIRLPPGAHTIATGITGSDGAIEVLPPPELHVVSL
jgi:4-amino-4-deoxy-L-arabinose transferase-like glycosyltransferase